MNKTQKEILIGMARKKYKKNDPSHDFQHALRVCNLACEIGKQEAADLDVLIPAALFHDAIVYKKNHPKSKYETEESARFTIKTLKSMSSYPQEKIEKVITCIKECSFSKRIKPGLLESKILQDADRLEATGAISIMRTFSSGGQMGLQFYDPADPFCKKGSTIFRSDIDLFYRRLLVVEKEMNTIFAKRIAKRRTTFLRNFLKELELELRESKVY